MKNKFLLLGATALLSTGAILANADPLPALPDASAELKVQIRLWNAAGITVEQDTIDFGTLAATAEHDGAKVTLSAEDGTREITGSGVVAADSGSVHKIAYLSVNVPAGYKATLNLPTNVTLYNDDSVARTGYQLNFKPEKYLYETLTAGTLELDSYYIGGSIDLSDEFHGWYEGSFVVTAVYTEDTTSGSGGE